MSVTTGLVYTLEATETVPGGGSPYTYTLSADSGDVVAGGGFDATDYDGYVVLASCPVLSSGESTGWTVTVRNQDVGSHSLKIYAVCVAAPGSRP